MLAVNARDSSPQHGQYEVQYQSNSLPKQSWNIDVTMSQICKLKRATTNWFVNNKIRQNPYNFHIFNFFFCTKNLLWTMFLIQNST